uniref:Uncharacterized protein n=1 Tax=Tetranychus urticae TaxID=32264 RepID=T1K2M2_TETUR
MGPKKTELSRSDFFVLFLSTDKGPEYRGKKYHFKSLDDIFLCDVLVLQKLARIKVRGFDWPEKSDTVTRENREYWPHYLLDIVNLNSLPQVVLKLANNLRLNVMNGNNTNILQFIRGTNKKKMKKSLPKHLMHLCYSGDNITQLPDVKEFNEKFPLHHCQKILNVFGESATEILTNQIDETLASTSGTQKIANSTAYQDRAQSSEAHNDVDGTNDDMSGTNDDLDGTNDDLDETNDDSLPEWLQKPEKFPEKNNISFSKILSEYHALNKLIHLVIGRIDRRVEIVEKIYEKFIDFTNLAFDHFRNKKLITMKTFGEFRKQIENNFDYNFFVLFSDFMAPAAKFIVSTTPELVMAFIYTTNCKMYAQTNENPSNSESSKNEDRTTPQYIH